MNARGGSNPPADGRGKWEVAGEVDPMIEALRRDTLTCTDGRSPRLRQLGRSSWPIASSITTPIDTGRPRPMEAAGGADAKSRVHTSLENRRSGFPQLPQVFIINIFATERPDIFCENLLPMSPDRSVT
jgi:hypothetical protein